MKGAIKWGLIIVGCMIVVVIAALLIVPMFIDIQKYKPMIEEKVAQATGRSFSVGDDLNLSLFPWAGLSLSDLQLGNPSGFAEKNFVMVKSFEVRVKLLPLLSKDIQVKRFVVNEPRIVLIKNKTGRANWEQPKQPAEKAPTKTEESPPQDTSSIGLPISALTVGNLAIKKGSAIWIDHSTDTRKEISDINLAAEDVSLERPVGLSFSAVVDNKPLSIEGTVGPIGKGLETGNIPMNISIEALKELVMRLKGSLENPATNPGVDLDIEIAQFSPRKLLAELNPGIQVKTSDPEALGGMALKFHVKADASKAALSNGVLNLDQSNLTFSLSAAEFSRPNLKFDLNLDQIDVDRYLPPKSDKAKGEQTSAPSEAGKKKTDYTPLRRIIMDGRIKIGNLIVSKAKIQDALLQIKANNGIITLDPMKLKLYQGGVSGKTLLNVTKDVPQSAMNLLVTGVQIGPLLQDVLDADVMEGTTTADINLNMVGDDPERIKQTLNGSGDLKFTDGALKGFDLAAMVRNVGTAFGLSKQGAERPKTDFTELLVPFTIKNGEVNTPQSSLKSPFIRVNAKGTTDLVQETLDFRVEPKAVASIKGQGDELQRSGLLVPVLVTGTYASPQFRPDLSAATKQQIEKKVFESKEAKKILEKEELKPLEKPMKDALKGILGGE
ncbi:MAG: AsmA family protein [Desulfobacterales bacterium]|jgi:AsmA protein